MDEDFEVLKDNANAISELANKLASESAMIDRGVEDLNGNLIVGSAQTMLDIIDRLVGQVEQMLENGRLIGENDG